MKHEKELAADRNPENSVLGFWERDLSSSKIYWPQGMYQLFGLPYDENAPHFSNLLDFIHSEDRLHFKNYYHCDGANSLKYTEIRVIQNNEVLHNLAATKETIIDEKHRPSAVRGYIWDVSELKQLQKKALDHESELNDSQVFAKLGTWEYDIENDELSFSKATYQIIESKPQKTPQLIENELKSFFPESRIRLAVLIEKAAKTSLGFDEEFEYLTKKGHRIDVRITCTATVNNNDNLILKGFFQDISETKKNHRQLANANKALKHSNRTLEYISNYDALTRLPNRAYLSERIKLAKERCSKNNTFLALAFIDLDGFKSVNDQYGHSIGDKFLIELASRLRACLKEGDTLSRLGGDEFVAVITDLNSPNDCNLHLTKILRAASEKIILGDISVVLSASIGATIYPQDSGDADRLLRHADQAMYIAKQSGKNQYHVFDVNVESATKTLHDDLARVRLALEQNEFTMYYQPKVNMRTGEVIGVEALVRWQHPTKGILLPSEFLPLIQNHFLSAELDQWVLHSVLKQLELWSASGVNIAASINVSAMQLQYDSFFENLQSALTEHPLVKPKNVELEILETTALHDLEHVVNVINTVKDLGIRFSLDDFGTGYSSLTYLKRLPAKVLKIDQSFVRDMLEDPDDLSIISGIIGLAQAFKRDVLAEGVETVEHGKALLSIGCELGQGFGIARPMPADSLIQWLKFWQPPQAWQKETKEQ